MLTARVDGGLMSKIPGTEANKEKKMEQGTGSGYNTGSSHTGSGDFACHHALMLICPN